MSDMQPPAVPSDRGRRRPFALLILIALMATKGVLILLMILGTFTSANSAILRALRIESIYEAVHTSQAALAGMLVIASVLLVSALGLLLFRRWAWLLAMVTTGIFVAVDIMGFFAGEANYIWMALNIITVFYLNQREVRVSVGVTSERRSRRSHRHGGRRMTGIVMHAADARAAAGRGAPAALRARPQVHPRRAVLPDAGGALSRGVATCSAARRSTTGRSSCPPASWTRHGWWSWVTPRRARSGSCDSSRSRSTRSSSPASTGARAARRSRHPAGSRASACSHGSSTPRSSPRSSSAARFPAAPPPPPRSSTRSCAPGIRASPITAVWSAAPAGSCCSTCSSTR